MNGIDEHKFGFLAAIAWAQHEPALLHTRLRANPASLVWDHWRKADKLISGDAAHEGLEVGWKISELMFTVCRLLEQLRQRQFADWVNIISSSRPRWIEPCLACIQRQAEAR